MMILSFNILVILYYESTFLNSELLKYIKNKKKNKKLNTFISKVNNGSGHALLNNLPYITNCIFLY